MLPDLLLSSFWVSHRKVPHKSPRSSTAPKILNQFEIWYVPLQTPEHMPGLSVSGDGSLEGCILRLSWSWCMASVLHQQVCGPMQRINTQENPAVPDHPSTSFFNLFFYKCWLCPWRDPINLCQSGRCWCRSTYNFVKQQSISIDV